MNWIDLETSATMSPELCAKNCVAAHPLTAYACHRDAPLLRLHQDAFSRLVTGTRYGMFVHGLTMTSLPSGDRYVAVNATQCRCLPDLPETTYEGSDSFDVRHVELG